MSKVSDIGVFRVFWNVVQSFAASRKNTTLSMLT